MCGIAGVFHPRTLSPDCRAAAPRMTRALAARGPDDHRVEELGGSAPFAVLGTQRLAIMDPAGNVQPVADPQSGRFWVAMNGEIYNHRRLRGELTGFDVAFRSEGDTEVVAGMVARQGVDGALPRFRGQFALAVVDTAERRLFLARDRMGQKPLYWTRLGDGSVAFASELKGLLQHPGVRRELDPVAVQQLLLFEYVPTPRSIWRGVHKLEPGSCLIADADGVRSERFWTPPVPKGPDQGSLKKWATSLHGSLQVATLHRMRADVPVGYLLSGGIDSSTVCALAAARSEVPLRTFSVKVDAPGFDESSHARLVAEHLGTEHTELRLGPEDLPGLLEATAASMDEPLADSSLVATWRLMAGVRAAGLTCVLSGDGADESLAGYPTYTAHLLARAPVLSGARGMLRAFARRMPTSHEGVSRDYMLRRFTEGLGLPWQRRHQVWMGAWLPEELGVSAAGEHPAWAEVDAHARAAEAAPGADIVARAMYLDQRLYLSDGVLVKVDRASMAHGLEVRSPFLDHPTVELCADIPAPFKLKGRESKIVLKRAMAEALPAGILSRSKQGFGTPVGPWLMDPRSGLLDDLPRALADHLDPALLEGVIAEHRSGRVDHRRRLWSALVLARWLEGPWGPRGG